MQNDVDPIAWEMQNFDLPPCARGTHTPRSLARFVREADTRDRNARGALTSEFHVESCASAATTTRVIYPLSSKQPVKHEPAIVQNSVP